MPQDSYEERLKYIFSNVNDWLKFAEAKNGALFALNIACLVAANEIFLKNYYLNLYLINFYCFSIISLMLCLSSYIPKLDLPQKIIKDIYSPKNNYNILYFNDISQSSYEYFIQDLTESKISDINGLKKFERDLVQQIFINSKITVKKYEFFTLAIWATISAFITPLLPILFILIKREK